MTGSVPSRGSASLDRLIRDTLAYARQQQAEGVRFAEAAAPRPPAARRPPAALASSLNDIAARVAKCRKCVLCRTRRNTVPGQGSSTPDILFVGEGPGEEEDRQGLAFVGRAGQLLTKIVEAMGYTRDQVFIGNIVKCRPPGNRTPAPDEMEACRPYLTEQIAALQPKVIVAICSVR